MSSEHLKSSSLFLSNNPPFIFFLNPKWHHDSICTPQTHSHLNQKRFSSVTASLKCVKKCICGQKMGGVELNVILIHFLVFLMSSWLFKQMTYKWSIFHVMRTRCSLCQRLWPLITLSIWLCYMHNTWVRYESAILLRVKHVFWTCIWMWVWKCVNIVAVEVKAWHKCRCRVVCVGCKRAYACICCDTAPIWCCSWTFYLLEWVLKLSSGKFFLGNSCTSYFSFLSHLFFFLSLSLSFSLYIFYFQ